MSLSDLNDIQIIEKIKEYIDDEKYIDILKQYSKELFIRYYDDAYKIARYYGLKSQDSEEVVQETFIRVFNNIKNYDVSKEFKPWFFKILLNCIKDKYKEINKHKYTDIQNLKEVLQKKDEEFYEKFHFQELLNSIINSLPNKLKSVVILKVYSEMDMNMISQTLGVSVRQLHNRLNKAYEIIKKLLEKDKEQ